MRLLLTIISILTVLSVFADQPRLTYSFKSANLIYEFKPCDTIFADKEIHTDSIYNEVTKNYFKYSYIHPDRYYWGLYDTKTNEKLYTIYNDSIGIEFMTAIISNDGSNITLIDDYSGCMPMNKLDIVYFYQKDKLMRILELQDLMNHMCNVVDWRSHMRWCFDFCYNNENQFNILTYEFYKYTFNSSGELLKKVSDERILDDDALVSAIIKRTCKNKYQITIDKSVRGNYIHNQILNIDCSDKIIKKIHGKFYGLFKHKNKLLTVGFWSVFLIRNNRPLKPNFELPYYTSDEGCYIFNDYNKNK